MFGKECILLNKIFEESWTNNISNISHEIINFFLSDDGNYYTYNNPFGEYGKRNKEYKPIYLILTTSFIKRNTVKILYLIKLNSNLHNFGYCRKDCLDPTNSTNKDNQYEIIKSIITAKNIRYGNKLLSDIYGKDDRTYMVTFLAEWIKEPIEPLEFTFNINDYNFQRNTGIVKCDKHEKTFNNLISIILNQNWKEYKLEKINEADVMYFKNKQKQKSNNKTFLDFICKTESEECYTNIFYNIFKENRILFNKFIQLHKNYQYKNIENQFLIEREKTVSKKNKIIGRMDICAESEKYRIVIENKINSGLNGINKDNSISQLSIYYNNWASCDNHKPVCFVIVIDSNYEILLHQIRQMKDSAMIMEQYTMIKYSQLLQFFQQNYEVIISNKNTFAAKFYDDIISLLGRISELKYIRTKNMFLEMISRVTE
ncbi:PD-(D/E)XK nuclease family protein [Treponema denticola]|uniref:PD-(D/E)XK nuclease family protein n=1 Tax=Treponema denticola TaxID=158 RepID=UPI0020A4D20E|nr:PD-(D/E)XK nuclease family protein [Treponema denticola]UTC88165.1 PD-(D/E)XK nuclease family protein [Treponema denticola]